MKKFAVLIGLFLLTFALCGFCQEHTWMEASCTEPKTCSVCGEAEGEALGHDWIPADCSTARTCARCGKVSGLPKTHTWLAADCEHPKICRICGETEGEALGHDWTAADCEHPKTCAVCGKTEGEALGHDWTAADCEHPKTCAVCGKTEGEAPGHAWERATCAQPKTCTRCGATEGDALEHQWILMSCTEPRMCLLCREREDAPAPGHVWKDADYTHPKTCEVCGSVTGAPLSFKVCDRNGYKITAGEYIEAYEAFLNAWAIWPYDRVNTCSVEKFSENDKFFSILLSGDDMPEEIDGVYTGFTLILTDKGMPVTDPKGKFDTVTIKYSHVGDGYTAKNSIELYLYMTGIVHLSDEYFPFAEDSQSYADRVRQRFLDTDLPQYRNTEYLGHSVYTFKADLTDPIAEYLWFEAACEN